MYIDNFFQLILEFDSLCSNVRILLSLEDSSIGISSFSNWGSQISKSFHNHIRDAFHQFCLYYFHILSLPIQFFLQSAIRGMFLILIQLLPLLWAGCLGFHYKISRLSNGRILKLLFPV